MEDKTLITVVAMVCITILESIALLLNIDGTILSMVVAVISGLAGYTGRMMYVSLKMKVRKK